MSDQLASKGGSCDEKPMEEIQRFFDDRTHHVKESYPLEKAIALSKTAEERSKAYKHDLYQAAITGVILSQKANLIVAEVPTGSGKSFIIAMLALHYYQEHKKEILVLVSNETLRK